jgi:hypothetical protein
VPLAEGDDTSERGAWWLQSVRLRRQAMRTSVSSMSTPTTRRAPHNCAGRCGGSTSACKLLGERDARTRLSRRIPNPRYNRHRARVHLRGVHEVGVQGASRVRPGGDGDTFELLYITFCSRWVRNMDIPMVIVIVSMCRDSGGNSGHGVVVVSTGEDAHPVNSRSGTSCSYLPV